MAKKKGSSGAPAWMCTFADMMSLLLCFFVLLLSFSVMDQQKFVEVAGSIEKAFGVQKLKPIIGNPRSQQMISPTFESVPLEARFQKTLLEIIEEELKSGVVEVEEEDDGLVLRVRETIAFASGSAEIKADFEPFLDKLGKAAADLEAVVTVSGHTDSQPIRKDAPYASNWSLSAARAVQVIEYWLARYRIPPQRLMAVGQADGQPVAGNATFEDRALNRRVEFKIRPGTGRVFEGIPGVEMTNHAGQSTRSTE